jgi:hypothetical protein
MAAWIARLISIEGPSCKGVPTIWSFHHPRLRRESYGELVQIDGSDHRWFEQRGEPCTLLAFIDDATSKLMQLRFVPSENTDSYIGALQGYLNDHGCPVAFYSDKHTVLRVNKPRHMRVSDPAKTILGRGLWDSFLYTDRDNEVVGRDVPYILEPMQYAGGGKHHASWFNYSSLPITVYLQPAFADEQKLGMRVSVWLVRHLPGW